MATLLNPMTGMVRIESFRKNSPSHMNLERAKTAYRSMLTSRLIDEREQIFVSQNLAHFHVSGAGHESTAILADHLRSIDYLHLHYRDKALLLARGIPIEEFFRSLLCRSGSHSEGRQMSAHFSHPGLRILSMVGPVGNNALQAVGVAAAIKSNPAQPIVICSIGDGTTQEGEFLEAIAEAVRWELPVLFLIQDNRWSISTPTRGKTFFDLPTGPAKEFYGMPIHRVDGSDVISVDSQFGCLVTAIRDSRHPQLLVLEVERLANHTNADDQTQYRDIEEINHCRNTRDPIARLRDYVLKGGVTASQLEELEGSVRHSINTAAEKVISEPVPSPIYTAKAPYPAELMNRPEFRGNSSTPQLNMREAICEVLKTRLAADSNVFLYGQDIEDPKGDVFGVTRGLSTAFPDRVLNAPLSESTIVGTCIGRALTGQRPVAFIQFADFLPLAFNQIVSELGSVYWRTNGGWRCPVILMVTCGGYSPGLGPFHAQSMDGFAAHIPGVDVVIPSSAADVSGLLNAAFESPRPTIFFYPKSSLNLSGRTTSNDVAQQFVLPGKASRLASGSDLTLVTWGNPVTQCESVVSVLSGAGFSIDLFDLRTLSPWDEGAVLASAKKTGKLVVVHEDNHTCGFGAEVIATVSEHVDRPLKLRRIARPDTFIPYQHDNQLDVLPSFKSILKTCADLLGCDVAWETSPFDRPGQVTIRAIGSGPADESVEVVAIHVDVGDKIQPGQVIAEIEATKAVAEVRASVAGTVTDIFATKGQRLAIGMPLVRLDTNRISLPPSVPIRELSGTARLVRRLKPIVSTLQAKANHLASIGIAGINCVFGSRVVTNDELIMNWPNHTADEISRLTGIECRRWVAPGETVVSIAADAARQLLVQHELTMNDLDLVIACTTTPDLITPSLACRVSTAAATKGERLTLAAYDINAACSGYLFALAQAWDFLQQKPTARVLIVTTEVLSPLLDMTDFNTAILFGDAATATLVVSDGSEPQWMQFDRPIISGSPDAESMLCVPLHGKGYLRMNGQIIFRQAVRSMINGLHHACDQAGKSP